jgi:hypothetical protein
MTQNLYLYKFCLYDLLVDLTYITFFADTFIKKLLPYLILIQPKNFIKN